MSGCHRWLWQPELWWLPAINIDRQLKVTATNKVFFIQLDIHGEGDIKYEIYDWPWFYQTGSAGSLDHLLNKKSHWNGNVFRFLFWWNFHHWLHWKLSKWQLPVQPVMKISSKWWHFRFGGSVVFNVAHTNAKFVDMWEGHDIPRNKKTFVTVRVRWKSRLQGVRHFIPATAWWKETPRVEDKHE